MKNKSPKAASDAFKRVMLFLAAIFAAPLKFSGDRARRFFLSSIRSWLELWQARKPLSQTDISRCLQSNYNLQLIANETSAFPVKAHIAKLHKPFLPWNFCPSVALALNLLCKHYQQPAATPPLLDSSAQPTTDSSAATLTTFIVEEDLNAFAYFCKSSDGG